MSAPQATFTQPPTSRTRTSPAAMSLDRDLRDALGALLSRVLCQTSEGSRAALVRQARFRAFNRHRQVVGQGLDPSLAFVVAGHLGVWRSDPDGRRQMIRIAHRGDVVSVLALRRYPVAPADLIGLDEGIVALWPGDLVMALARTEAGLAVDLLEHALTSAARLLERLDRVTFDTVSRRPARILWQERALLFDPVRPLLSRPELADLAGATREMTDRVIRALETQGSIRRVGRSGLVLEDVAKLKALAEVDPGVDPGELTVCGREPSRRP